MSQIDALVDHAHRYEHEFTHGQLTAPSALKLAVLTCMDGRIILTKMLGIHHGDAHVLRNAGGIVTDDVLRSLAVSMHVLGTQEVMVLNHTDCRLLNLSEAEVRKIVADGAHPGAELPHFHAFDELDANVRVQLRALRASPLLPASFIARGFVYDVVDGRLREVL